ncbi:hypothetical protein TWF569_000622 [Orbilia oligospora]|uniref:Guanine nucleotide-binding protein subunit gamma n=1 Tax=Orbilia oligospora TaxID=2813651 RepID=A0A7C8NIB9_ORBOL|nr:hypothetical protein TWF102_000538 [Orbilia oligospora]KAF3097441.1 hypothetical protein TWF706_007303 [Orbilia oligospora]KAF3104353.1 hypothetical protein TWF103_007007 [Orbilia oligospora]KAF3126058.1 hypothetical protein TWF569_000622 [Orbilia oligospora]KAF3129589.1 hypothetical protein TWF594_010884 [Orbilia oligospora]
MAVHNQAGAREPAREKKGSMQELKLRRLTELNARLREDLERPRVKVSEACSSMINYTKTTKDFMVPATWGQVSLSPSPTAKHKFHRLSVPDIAIFAQRHIPFRYFRTNQTSRTCRLAKGRTRIPRQITILAVLSCETRPVYADDVSIFSFDFLLPCINYYIERRQKKPTSFSNTSSAIWRYLLSRHRSPRSSIFV